MSDVCSKYSISAALPGSYTITNNDRQANFTLTQTSPGINEALSVICFNSPSLDGHVIMPIEGDVIIKRARLVPSGAFGLHSSPGKLAGKFYLKAVNIDNDTGEYNMFDQVALKFNDWCEWIDSNAVLRPYKRSNATESNRDYVNAFFGIQTDYSEFYIDDYNLQSAYESQNVLPILEMEVEASAGLWDTDAKILF